MRPASVFDGLDPLECQYPKWSIRQKKKEWFRPWTNHGKTHEGHGSICKGHGSCSAVQLFKIFICVYKKVSFVGNDTHFVAFAPVSVTDRPLDSQGYSNLRILCMAPSSGRVPPLH